VEAIGQKIHKFDICAHMGKMIREKTKLKEVNPGDEKSKELTKSNSSLSEKTSPEPFEFDTKITAR